MDMPFHAVAKVIDEVFMFDEILKQVFKVHFSR
jgi:hypothetical protein